MMRNSTSRNEFFIYYMQNMLVNAMMQNDAVLALFKAAVIATEMFKGEEK